MSRLMLLVVLVFASCKSEVISCKDDGDCGGGLVCVQTICVQRATDAGADAGHDAGVDAGQNSDSGTPDATDAAVDAGVLDAGTCGDHEVNYGIGEECDDGNSDLGDGCSICRVDLAFGACGDSVVDSRGLEECDDGNADAGDGCSSTCQLEPVGGRCGDATRQADEACDDGNTINGDACNPTCNLRNGVSTWFGGMGVNGWQDAIVPNVMFGGTGTLFAGQSHIYFSDTTNHTVRRVNVASGSSETLGGDHSVSAYVDAADGGARFETPTALASDGTTLWIVDTHRIRAMTLAPPYAVRTLTGTGVAGCVDGAAGVATLADVRGLVFYRRSLFAVDATCAVVREIDPTSGAVTTVAGAANQAGRDDGVGSAARFVSPTGVTSDNSGVLYISDVGAGTLRSFDVQTRRVRTLAGGMPGYRDDTGVLARLQAPEALTNDGTSLYWVESGQHVVRQAPLATIRVSTLAGAHCDGGVCSGSLMDRSGTQARFNAPSSIVFHFPSRSLFVMDTGNEAVRRIR